MRVHGGVAGLLGFLLLPGCGGSSVCGAGFEEQDGECVAVCASVCGDHQSCVAVDDGAECQCVAGYEGDPCVWTGAIVDPEFTDATAWSDTNGAAILPLELGQTVPGIAAFEASVVCNAGAVSQTVTMPSYELAEPLVIEATYRALATAGVAVGYNRAFRTWSNTDNAWETRRVCLGEAGYGGEVTFQVASAARTQECFSSPGGTFAVDRITVVPAEPGECPGRGVVLNGEANIGEGGWFFEPEPFAIPAFGLIEGGLVEGVGESGTSGARIYKEPGGENRIDMGTKVSVALPATVPSPALSFWWKASPGTQFIVNIGSYENDASAVNLDQLDTLVGDGAEQTYTYCLPPWTHGNTIEVSFRQSRIESFVDNEGELIVDSMRVDSDSKCGDWTDLADPSFDAGPNRWAHARLSGAPADSVQLLNDEQLAHPPGAGVLALSYQQPGSLVAMGRRLWIPSSRGNSGPMLVFYSNLATDARVPVVWRVGVGGPLEAELLPGNGWRRNEVCLPPEWSERWFRFGVTAFVFPDIVLDAPERVLLDDFELTTSESCPTETQ